MLGKKPEKSGDPEDLLVGTCATCNQKMTCLRMNTKKGEWGPCIACPKCHAKVYVTKRLVTK